MLSYFIFSINDETEMKPGISLISIVLLLSGCSIECCCPFILHRLRLMQHAYLENIDEPGAIEQLPNGDDDDPVFGAAKFY